MEASETTEDFVAGGLASLGIETDEVELAVARAAHELFWPPIQELLDLDTSDAPVDRAPDLSGPPRR